MLILSTQFTNLINYLLDIYVVGKCIGNLFHFLGLSQVFFLELAQTPPLIFQNLAMLEFSYRFQFLYVLLIMTKYFDII